MPSDLYMRAALAGCLAGLAMLSALVHAAAAQEAGCPWELPLVPEDTGRERYEYPSQALKPTYRGKTVEYTFTLGAIQRAPHGTSTKPPGCVRTVVDIRAGMHRAGCVPGVQMSVAGKLTVRCPSRYYWNDRARIERVCQVRLGAARVTCK